MKGLSPHEVGLVVGAAIGFIWGLYRGPHYGRSSGTAGWILHIMICGAIGGLAGLILEWVFRLLPISL